MAETTIQPASSGSVRLGARLNGVYEVGPLIAHGGMGEVYRGFNIVTNDPVAIKMILPELSGDTEAFAMFKREASVLLNLHHEAIVRYFVFSVDPELQRAYLAMEFVDGPSLSKRLAQEGPLPLDEVKILQRRLADALETAHRLGVVHRDISSDNVILPGGDPRRAKIIDFGIARSLRVGEGTILGSRFAGKSNYASPEQFGLAGGEVGPKSDIYSLGLVLAEAALGGALDMGGTQAEIIEKRRKIPDLSALDFRLRPLVAAMLQPLPAARPPSMAAVAAWTPGGARASDRSRRDSSAFGRSAGLAAALIVIVSVGGALYAYRDLLPWWWPTADEKVSPPAQQAREEPEPARHNLPALPAPSSASHAAPNQQAVSTHPLPPLPETPADNSMASVPPHQAATAPPTPEHSAKPASHVPTADELVSALKPLPENPSQQTAAVENPLAADIPAPVQTPPQPAVPESKIKPSPTPTAPAPFASLAPAQKRAPAGAKPTNPPQLVSPAPAPEQKVPSASPKPASPSPVPEQKTAPAAPKPAPGIRAPRDQLALEPATVGKDYVVDLPPFSDAADPKGVALRAEPSLPEGLVLADLGQGFGRISGAPATAGQYSFSIVASDPGGATAQMAAQLSVAAAEPSAQSPAVTPPAPQPDTVAAATEPAEKAVAFLRDYDGGPCFLARPLSVSGSKPVILGIGANRAAFERFYAGFNREVGLEPTLIVKLIAPSQCPAVDLIGAAPKEGAEAPKIELVSFDVGRSRPLAGQVTNLASRSLALLVVSSDGQVRRIEAKPAADGSSATFKATLVVDEAPKDLLQVIVAVVSPKPLASLADFRSGAAGTILPRVQREFAATGGSLDTEFFRLAN